MNWAQRRKITYIAIILATIALVAFLIIHKATAVAPSCFDNKQDGTETGIDCGGTCNTYCAGQLSDPIVEWVRVFPVTPGISDAIAYIQHNHPVAGAENVSYDFKLYDANNTILADRTGTTYLGPAGQSAIVETLIPVDSSKVTIARFSFFDPVHWQKISPAFSQIVINTDQHSVETFTTGSQNNTRLVAVLQNLSRYNFTNLDAIAIFYDSDGNALTTSKVLVPSLGALQNRTVYFTWPYQINNIARTEIITRFNPFTTQSL
ncbi:MAG TPA: hypothetical protein VL576_01810 [Candidatus Paceibacterota bacterium]|jgi:hypothetical protein|nr:hypothetical protein [Candidatus Paceibacterota bacterium]